MKISSEVTSTAIAIFSLIWLVPFFIFVFHTEKSEAGQLGDTFGIVNSLFSGLAMLGVAATVWLQHQDMKQRTIEAGEAREAARLQLLPTLIERTEQKLRQLGAGEVIDKGYSLNTLESWIKIYEADIQGLPVRIAALVDDHNNPPPAPTVRHFPDGLLKEAQELGAKLSQREFGVREIKILRQYVKDFDSLYARVEARSSAAPDQVSRCICA